MSIDYTPTTELDAVNAILAASNQAPIAALPSTRPDVVLAQGALAAALHDTMSSRWRFNTDINYQLAGTPQGVGQYVYPEPANLLAFTVTPTEAQRGLDIVSRPSRTYQVGGASVRILASRVGGLDTLPQSTININPVWAVPFALAPEAARRCITLSAIRRRIQQLGYKDQIEGAAADEQQALSALTAQESAANSPLIVADGWATELDALNTILATAGQRGVPDVLEADDVSLRALNALRQAVTDVCSMGWRFNTEVSYGVNPLNVIYNWVDVDGTTTPVLIYAVPDRTLTVTPSGTLEQTGTKRIDPVVQKAERYRDVNNQAPLVFYDRTNHRDGFPSAERTVLRLDVTWRKPFDEMPESARHYATVLAGRRFCATFGTTPRWSQQDEASALLMLQRAEGIRDVRNLFAENADMRAFRGRRRSVLY